MKAYQKARRGICYSRANADFFHKAIPLAAPDNVSNKRHQTAQTAQTIISLGYYPHSQLRNTGCYAMRKCDTGASNWHFRLLIKWVAEKRCELCNSIACRSPHRDIYSSFIAIVRVHWDFGCGSCRRTKGIGIFKLPLAKDENHKRWRNEWLGVLKKTREMDKDFKRQIDEDKLYTCEKHFLSEDIEI